MSNRRIATAPSESVIFGRLLNPLDEGRYRGLLYRSIALSLYRAINPVYAHKPLSGTGAERFGGRFNPKGIAAIYTALDPTVALREANQAGSLQPTVMVSYAADIGPIFDTRNVDALHQRGVSEAALKDPSWRRKMLEGHEVPTQSFAERLIKEGFLGLLVRSFAKGASDTDFNIVLWQWTGVGCALSVVDDEDRLSRMWDPAI